MSIEKVPLVRDVVPPIPTKEDIYIGFASLRSLKQDWLSEKLNEGYRVFITLKSGPPIELSFVEYK